MASTLGQFTPVPRVPQAYTSGPVTALRVTNGSAYVLRVILGGALYDKVPAGADQTYNVAHLGGFGGWILLVPGEAPVNQNKLAGPVTVTSYGSSDAIPYGTITQQSEALYSPSLAQPDWILDTLRGALRFNVKMFGAQGDGTTDDTAALAACINACRLCGGGEVELPSGTYAISSTLVLGNGGDAVRLVGAGTQASILKWTGSAGADMVQITGSGAATQGNSLADLQLDGNSLAGIGLHLTSAQYAQFGALSIVNTTTACLKLDTLTSGSGTLNTLANHFGKLYLSPAAGTSGQQSVGLWLDGSATSGADTNNNTFENVTLNAVQNYTTGLRLGFCDFNNFGMLNTFVSGTGAYGLLLDGSVSSGFPKNNYFVQANFASAPQVTGTVGNNWVQHLDMSDGAASIPTSGLFGLADNVNGEAGLIPFGVTPLVNSQASAINQEITVTTGQNVVSVFGAPDGLYVAHLYFRITGASNVTITATAFSADETANRSWTFEGSGSGALTLLNAASLAPGGYYCLPIVMRYASGGAQTPVIQVTASTANVVYATASITKVA